MRKSITVWESVKSGNVARKVLMKAIPLYPTVVRRCNSESKLAECTICSLPVLYGENFILLESSSSDFPTLSIK